MKQHRKVHYFVAKEVTSMERRVWPQDLVCQNECILNQPTLNDSNSVLDLFFYSALQF